MEDSLSAKWHAREQARMRLVRLRVEEEGSLARALDRACLIAQKALGVARVSVWELSEGEGLRCVHALDHEDRREPPLLSLEQLGRYDEAMRERRVLAARDVNAHAVTRSLVDGYFAPFGITATIDAPIYREGKLTGMVCHEHRGGQREWTDEEAAFAVSVGDIVASLFASSELRLAVDTLREREIALREAMTSDALARVARGVAHDVNNVLAVVFTAVGVIERGTAPPEHHAEAMAAIRDAAESAARLVQQLLAFGRPAMPGDGSVLDEALALHEAMLRRIVGPSSTCSRGARPMPTRAQGESGGQLAILEIEDDGAGMDALTRARMFEPFFSTKSERGRSGFGLAIVDGVVRASGGRIDVESELGKGTRVRISLPVGD